MPQLSAVPAVQTLAQTTANAPVSGALATYYVAGTVTKVSIYADHLGATPLANPVTADVYGRFVSVFMAPGTLYDLAMTTSTGAALDGYPLEDQRAPPISSQNTAMDGTAGEAISAGAAVYLSDGSGSKTAGLWYLADADNPYSSTLTEVGIAPDAIASLAVGTILIKGQVTGLTGLTIGLPYYISATAGALTATAPTNARYMGQADSATSLVVDPGPALGNATVDIQGTAGEALAAGDGVYLSDGSNSLTAGRWYKWDADFIYASTQPMLGIVPAAIASAASGTIRLQGRVTGLTLTAGVTYYVSATAGGLTATAPATVRAVGQADSTTSLVFAPNAQPKPLVVGYPATLAPVSNIGTEVTALTFVVPANSWNDGDRIEVYVESLSKANGLSGGVGTATFKVNCGAGAQVTLGASNRADDATEYTVEQLFTLVRAGATVSVCVAFPSTFSANGNSAGARTGSSTPTNFTSDFTVSLKVTLSEATANFWWKPQSARVYRVKATAASA